jgi:hypothetical protein
MIVVFKNWASQLGREYARLGINPDYIIDVRPGGHMPVATLIRVEGGHEHTVVGTFEETMEALKPGKKVGKPKEAAAA